MTTTQTTSPTEISFYADHTTETLQVIVERYTADAKYMASNGASDLATEAVAIANAAWAQLALRGAA